LRSTRPTAAETLRRVLRWTVAIALLALAGILTIYVFIPLLSGARDFSPEWAGTAAEYLTALFAAAGLFGLWSQLRLQQLRDKEESRRDANSLHLSFDVEPWLRGAAERGTAVSIYVTNMGQERAALLQVTVCDLAGTSCPDGFYIHRAPQPSIAPDPTARIYVCTVHIPECDREAYLSSDAGVRTLVEWSAAGGRVSMRDNGQVEFVGGEER
jgi:hypothetical protein